MNYNVKGTLEKTESDLEKIYADLEDVRNKMAELKNKESKLLESAETKERMRVLQIVQFSDIDIDSLKNILSSSNNPSKDVFMPVKNSLTTERNTDNENDDDE